MTVSLGCVARLRREACQPETTLPPRHAFHQSWLGAAVSTTGAVALWGFILFYGIVIVFTFAFAYIYRIQLECRPELGYGLLLLFIMGLGLRAWANVT